MVVLDSVQGISARFGDAFDVLEWGFTLVFTVEYVARLLCVRHPLRYALSFYGVIDLLALLPTYLALLVPEVHALIDVRVLRLLRVFRVFKLTAYMSEYQSLGRALQASRRKIMVFLAAVLMIVLVMLSAALIRSALFFSMSPSFACFCLCSDSTVSLALVLTPDSLVFS